MRHHTAADIQCAPRALRGHKSTGLRCVLYFTHAGAIPCPPPPHPQDFSRMINRAATHRSRAINNNIFGP